MFKISSALCIDFIHAHAATGVALPAAKTILDDNMGAMAALQVSQASFRCNLLEGHLC